MTIEINLNELGRVQYLTEVLPEIPTNTILYKKLTGLGATYGEITAKRNSIIIEPNVPVIIGKCNDPKHKDDNLFGVYEGVYTDDIVNYLEKSKKKYYKILTTPESFQKVKDAFEELEMSAHCSCSPLRGITPLRASIHQAHGQCNGKVTGESATVPPTGQSVTPLRHAGATLSLRQTALMPREPRPAWLSALWPGACSGSYVVLTSSRTNTRTRSTAHDLRPTRHTRRRKSAKPDNSCD